MSIKNELISFSKKNNADLIGIASMDNELFEEVRAGIEETLPETKSIVVVGVKLNREAVSSNNVRLAQYDSMYVYQILDSLAFKIVRFLQEKGFKAVAIPPFLPVDMSIEKKGLYGDLSHKKAAVAAGLGTIGLNALLITPEFGPFIRLASILTNAVLEPSTPIKEDICDECGKCIESCPQQALSLEGIDVGKCTRSSLEYGLPGLIRFIFKVHGSGAEEAKKLISSPTLWNIWQTFITDSFYGCFECIKDCPIGK